MKYFYRNLNVGILGGGQLGRMLLQAAIDFNLNIHVLDPDSQAPCRHLANDFVVGSLTDFDTVYQFGEDLDVITIEIENVNTEALEALEKEGKKVYPAVNVIRMIQNKCEQKKWLKENDLPTADFILVNNRKEIEAQAHRLPFVNKLASGGYDGRGVQVVKSATDFEKTFDAVGLIEDLVPIQKELAVIVARNPSGEMQTFPSVEMAFHPTANLVEFLFSPAEIPAEVEAEAREIAQKIVEKMEYVGLLAVELFWDTNGKLWVNELAPRPHNSGHHTIRCCETSQYEQHLRAILDLPLGNTDLLTPAAMLNLLGEEGHSGEVIYQGVEEALAFGGVYPHFYGKKITKPFRKMGHVTILAREKTALVNKVRKVQKTLKVVSGS
ncbi:MAG: 5-(carboxyamino)imidazole ribonucleotide synthase [Bacteroidia bacterium]